MKIDWKLLGKTIGSFIRRRSPEILTGIGVAGMGVSVIFAVRATPKAVKAIEEIPKEEQKPLTVVKKTWKYYVPAAVSFVVGASCVISATCTNYHIKAALAAACSVTENTMKDYKGAVKEVVGDRTEEKIEERAKVRAAERHEFQDGKTYELTGTESAVFDPWTGKDFPYDIDKLKRAIEDISYRLQTERYLTLNDFYDQAELPLIKGGGVLGWVAEKGPIRPNFSSTLVNDRPCLVLGFSRNPSVTELAKEIGLDFLDY